MQNITVNEEYKEIIPLANEASSATLAYTIYIASTGATFATGNLTYVVGKQWSFSFTPLTVGEIYIIEVLDAESQVIFTKAYKGLTSVADETESTNITISKTALANKALILIGAEAISSIDSGETNADIMNAIYSTALKGILSECLWGFATKRALLVSSATTMAWYHTSQGESQVYAKPTDIIRIIGTNDDYAIWRDEGSYIVSDTIGLGIKYVYFNDDPTTYPASFTEAFVDLLASQASFMILNDKGKAEDMLAKYHKISLPKAMSENSQVGTQQYMRDDAWELAKYNNTSPEA